MPLQMQLGKVPGLWGTLMIAQENGLKRKKVIYVSYNGLER